MPVHTVKERRKKGIKRGPKGRIVKTKRASSKRKR